MDEIWSLARSGYLQVMVLSLIDSLLTFQHWYNNRWQFHDVAHIWIAFERADGWISVDVLTFPRVTGNMRRFGDCVAR